MKLLRLQIQMAAITLCAFQRRKYRTADTHGGIEGSVVLSHDRVHTLEAETGYLAELKRVIPQDIHTARAKMVIDLRGGGRCDLEGSQQAMISSSFALLTPRISSSRSGSFSSTFNVSAPNRSTISSAVLPPMPLISREDRYPLIPSRVWGTISSHCATCS